MHELYKIISTLFKYFTNMKKQGILKLIFLLVICFGFTIYLHKGNAQQTVVRHVVAFQFKDDVPEHQREQAVKDFLELKNRIPEIRKFEGGQDISVEGHNKGFTHCFVLTFEHVAGRDAYLPHPAHLEVVKKNKPLMKDLFVFDYVGEQ